MNTIKQSFLSLVLAFVAVTGSLSAMNENSEQSNLVQSVAQSLCNTFSAVKNASQYTVNFVAAEVMYLPEAINGVLIHMISHDEEPLPEQNVVEPKKINLKKENSMAYDAYTLLSAMKNRVTNGVSYTHDLVIEGANYTHDVINGALNHIAQDGE